MVEDTQKVLCPKGDGSGNLDLTAAFAKAAQAQARLQEVATVTPHKAGELMTALNDAWHDLQRLHTKLTYHKASATEAVKETKADVLLGLNDQAVKELGFTKSSADIRAALVERDQRTKEAKERVRQITAFVELVAGKMRRFDNGYTAIKRLLDATSGGGQHNKTFRDMPKQADPDSSYAGFGTPRK